MAGSLVLALAMFAAETGAFVGAGVGAQLDNTWAETHSAPAVLVTVGADVSEHVGIRMAVDVPTTAASIERGSVLGPDRVQSTETHHSTGWSGFVDVHGHLSERVRIAGLAGLTYTVRPMTLVLSRDLLGAGNAVLAHTEMTQRSRYDWAGLAFGVETQARATTHLSVVPMATVTFFPLAEYGRTSIGRVGAETRWRF